MIYPENFEIKTGFDKIRQLLIDYCVSDLGKKNVDEISFSSSFEHILKLTEEVKEICDIFESKKDFPSGHYIDVRPYLARVKVKGSFLELEQLIELKMSFESVAAVYKFIKTLDAEKFPRLTNLIKDVVIHSFVIDKLNSVLNKNGKLRDTASNELKKIRQELSSKQRTVSTRMDAFLKQAQKDGFVNKDTNLTMRSGRLVIPVSATNKRKIKGFIHDESASGKTAFVEPAEIFETNNEIRELGYAEQREIVKILQDVTEFIRPYIEDLLDAYTFIGLIDFIRAKARFAQSINAVCPIIKDEAMVNWKNSRHPLLFLSHQNEGKKVVPLSVDLNNDDRILLISGPNAGGKSVCLKTVGLLQYMIQCGLLVPMDKDSEMGIFKKIFIDIGDEQSIENDLSTYSSHLMNMKYFIKNIDEKSLILIDEFGAGTEPLLGGAIAESILDQLNKKGGFGLVTTHYTNLKHFAASTDGIINGAMQYDQNKMQPLFKLEIGKPGSSFAFEIARKIGLSEEVLQSATDKVGKKQVNFDKLLKDVVRDKRYWENKRKKIRQSEKKLDDLLEDLSDELKRTAKSRKKILKEAKDDADKLLAGTNKVIENTVKIIRENQAEKEKTKEARKQLDRYKSKFRDKIKKEESEDDKTIQDYQKREKHIRQRFPNLKNKELSVEEIRKNIEAEIRIGDNVKLKDSDSVGEVVEMNTKNFIVAFGNLVTSVSREKLIKISSNEYKKITKGKTASSGVGWNLQKKRINFKSTIDVRGMRVEEVLPVVYEFIDDCITLDVNEVRILHGTGSGILRQYIREYLRSVEQITWFGDEDIQMGGAGITVIKFKKDNK